MQRGFGKISEAVSGDWPGPSAMSLMNWRSFSSFESARCLRS